MVCNRCKAAVQAALLQAGLRPVSVELGEVVIEDPVPADALSSLNQSLLKLGFEIIDDRKSRIIEKIKNVIITLIHHSEEHLDVNLSEHIAGELNYEYSYLSNLFSEVEGTTIEKFLIAQKTEKVKELLMYDELTLSQIADKMNYSSVAHLSNQFKKQTGLSPTFYKSQKQHKRRNIEEL